MNHNIHDSSQIYSENSPKKVLATKSFDTFGLRLKEGVLRLELNCRFYK